MKPLLALFAILFLTACTNTLATPQHHAHELKQEQVTQYRQANQYQIEDTDWSGSVSEARYLNIVFPLLKAAAEFCGDNITPDYGAIIYDPTVGKDGPKPDILLQDGLILAFVTKDFPAWNKGIRKGAIVTQINGQSLANMPFSKARTIALNATKGGKPINLSFTQDGKTQQAVLPATSICRFQPYLKHDDALNAWADGKAIYVTTKMMQFTTDDRELALVLAHEIAHNVLGHVTKKQGNAILGSLADTLTSAVTGISTGGLFGKIGGLAYSQAFESESDYLGLYIMARAGMDISTAPNFWRRMGQQEPRSIQGSFISTHPSAPERYLTLEKTIREIQAKQKAGLPLIPNAKEG